MKRSNSTPMISTRLFTIVIVPVGNRYQEVETHIMHLVNMKRISVHAVTDVLDFLRSTNYSKQELSEGDMITLLKALEYDKRVESMQEVQNDPQRLYRATLIEPYSAGLLSAPCGSCPVAAACTEGGVVSPSTCIYLPEWLNY